MGQGSTTAYAQIVGEVLGLAAESVSVVHADTRVTPYDMGTLGSRSLYHMGNALISAATEIRDQLLDIARSAFDIPVDQLSVADGAIITSDGRRLSFRELMLKRFNMQAGTLIGRGDFTPSYAKPEPGTGQSPDVAAFWMFGGAAVEVSVDTETGALTVDRMVVIGDSGRAINPDIVRAQFTGAAVMQLGMARSEELIFENGQLVNTGLAFYKVPGIADMPPHFEGRTVEFPVEGDAPFGAKGVGETGSFAVASAIANAVDDAVGARVMELPVTHERIWQAMTAAELKG